MTTHHLESLRQAICRNCNCPHKIEIPMLIYIQVHVEIMSLTILHVSGQNYQMKSLYNCVSIWAPNQVKWPRPIRSELHVKNLTLSRA